LRQILPAFAFLCAPLCAGLTLAKLLAERIGMIEPQLAGLTEILLSHVQVAAIVIGQSTVVISLSQTGIDLQGTRVVIDGMRIVFLLGIEVTTVIIEVSILRSQLDRHGIVALHL